MKQWLHNFWASIKRIFKPLEPETPRHGILLWGPEYDELTRRMSEWLEHLPVPEEIPTERLVRRSVGRNEIQESLQNQKVDRRLAIFCGYGYPSGLLGAPQDPDTDILVRGKRHSVIYGPNMLGNGPEAMFAFCPDAGQALGDGFASVPGRVFLGYAGNIGVALLNEECCEYWKTIFDGAALPIAESGTISDEDKKRLMKLYDRAFSHFWTGDGKKNKYRGLMLNYLLQHQQNLCLKPQPHA